jgi:LPS O-antigen subunit length determinant protein (WzzB/FepE family)
MNSQKELSINELWEILINYRWAVGITVAVSLSSSILYSYLATPQYLVTTEVTALQQESFDMLNPLDVTGKRMFADFTPESIFEQFNGVVSSTSSKVGFLSNFEWKTVGYPKISVKEFLTALTIRQVRSNQVVTIDLRLSDPSVAAMLLNRYMDYVDRKAMSLYQQLAMNKIVLMKSRMQAAIVLKLKLAKLERLSRVDRLENAAVIAGWVGIEKGMLKTNSHEDNYLRGVKALRAHAKLLRQTVDDSLYVNGIEVLKLKMAELNNFKVEMGKVSSITIARRAEAPLSPFYPRRKLMIVIGALLGLISGLSLAFILNFARERRLRIDSAA